MSEWDTLQAIYRTRGAATRAYHKVPPPVQTLINEFSTPPHVIGEFIYMCENYNVRAMSAEHYLRRNCYYLPAIMQQMIEDIAACGLFAPAGMPATYSITPKGERFFARADELLQPRWSLPPAESETLTQVITLLRPVVKATLDGNLPCETWAVQTRAQYGSKVAPTALPFQQLNELIFDLWAYRDDSHLAAWRVPYPDISPQAWEALSVLWEGKANTPAATAEALKDHGFSADDYAVALQTLLARGWVTEDEAIYTLTADGKKRRDTAETLTNEYFYTPFSVLTAAERAELNTAMEQVLAALQAIAAQ
ncbi:MAG: hypothetical protein U0694_07615 [Anaerolineae bacterium]